MEFHREPLKEVFICARSQLQLPTRGFVWIGFVFVFLRGVFCSRPSENQTTKPHEPESRKDTKVQLMSQVSYYTQARFPPFNNKTGRNSHTCRPRLILDMQIAAASARRQTSVRCARDFFVLEHQ